MIDTVVLMLEQHQYQITNHGLFSPSTENFFKPPYPKLGKMGATKATQNPTKKDFEEGNYKPRLTVTLRKAHGYGFNVTLRIEFSAAKLLRGNNFDELSDCEFGNLLAMLRIKLEAMGVKVNLKDLATAKVSSVHYSKNVFLTDYTRCTMLLEELATLNLWSRLDINKTDYRNGGHVLKWHANSYEIAVYDKLKDYQQSKVSPKRAYEKDSEYQPCLFDVSLPKQLEVLRLEIRLNKRQLIRSLFKKLNIETELEFESLFSTDISKAVISHFFDTILAEIKMVNLLQVDMSNPVMLAESIIIENPNIKPDKVLRLIGGLSMLQSSGASSLKAVFAGNSKRSVSRIITDCKKYIPNKSSRWLALQNVKNQLKEFEPVSLKKFEIANNQS